MGPNEEQVYFLEVMPSDSKPFKAKGKDFEVNVQWGGFGAYSPSSDLQSHDPSYTKIVAKSKGAARKFYKILKADPDALKNIDWRGFDSWLDRNKVGYDTQFSQWN